MYIYIMNRRGTHCIILLLAIALIAITIVNTPATAQPLFNPAGLLANPSAEPEDTITIAMVGDIMMGNSFRNSFPTDDGRHLFDDPKEILLNADITCGNLEGTIAISGKPRKNPESKMAYMFMMPPHYTQNLVDAGFDFVSIANNHIYDFYEEAMTQTEENLENYGVGFAGARDPKRINSHRESFSKVFTSKSGRDYKVGYCAFCHEDYTQRTMDTAAVRRIITGLKDEGCQYVVVSFHGGCEGSGARHLPYGHELFYGDDRGDMRFFTHYAIDCGADIVYGHGPHVVRAIELYNGHFIAYSLGNFCTFGFSCAGLTGNAPLITVRMDTKGRFIDGRIHSFRQKPSLGPKIDSANAAAKEIATLTKEDITDSKLDISPDGTITIRE